MEDNSVILSKLILRKKPEVPPGFFEQFKAGLKDQLTDESEGSSFALKKSSDQKVPEGFFKNFYSELQAEIETEKVFADLKIQKRPRPSVQPGFEESFRKALYAELSKQKPGGGRILKLSLWSVGAAAAASLAILWTLNINQPAPEPVAHMEISLSGSVHEESLDAYVAYLDEDELIDYILENDIDLGESETDDDLFDYVGSDIEDIYMDL